METVPFILCDSLVKIYETDGLETVALGGLDLEVAQGEVLAVIGPSGSGKSSLLNILGGLDRPTAGTVRVAGLDLLDLSQAALVRYRRDMVGFVWQESGRNLLPYLTAIHNVQLPMRLAGVGGREQARRAGELLEAVGLGDRLTHRPEQLSGGEQQRVAIAMAMANAPALLLADEPTGSVDSQTAAAILDIFHTLSQRYGVTVIVVTHDPSITEHVDRSVAIHDGRTSFERVRRAEDVEGSHDEYAVVDATGWLQLPAAYMEKLGIRKRVRVHLEDDHIRIWPATEN